MTIQYGTDRALHQSAMVELSKKKAEPENLTHADTVTIKDLDDAFTLAQVDNLVAELDN